MKLPSKILALSKNDDGELFPVIKLKEVLEQASFNNLNVIVGECFYFEHHQASPFELYWLPAKYIFNEKTGTYSNDNELAIRLFRV